MSKRKKRIAIIRTTDRIFFKKCRRLWNWTSHLRQNYTTKYTSSPLWLGTGVHFALEDYHGYRYFETPAEALMAFADACKRSRKIKLHDGWKEDLELGIAMMDYYLEWLINRDPLTTLVIDGEPQVEVSGYIKIPIDHPDYDEIWYSYTFDRVTVDADNHLHVVEYKTAARFEDMHLPTDPQVTAYCWALQHHYPDYEGWGVIYQQHKKTEIKEPHILSNGKISTNKSQGTTYRLYKNALDNLYGDYKKAPAGNLQCLDHLMNEESEDRDKFIIRHKVTRSEHQLLMEEQKILLEVPDMLNPELPLYPNPTRDCKWCSFADPCVMFDEGGDWEDFIEWNYISRREENVSWRPLLRLPDQVAS